MSLSKLSISDPGIGAKVSYIISDRREIPRTEFRRMESWNRTIMRRMDLSWSASVIVRLGPRVPLDRPVGQTDPPGVSQIGQGMNVRAILRETAM